MPSFVLTLISLALLFGLAILVAGWLNHRKRLRAPRITAAEFDAFEARLAAARLPVAWVSLKPHEVEPEAGASRIGGRPYADSARQKWPVRGDARVPMLFIGQINFAETPPLEDFPSRGLLQLFVLADDRGHLEAAERKTDRVIRWFPDPAGAMTLDPPESLTRMKKRGSFSPRVMRDGLAMTFEAGHMDADPQNWPYSESYPSLRHRLAESDALNDRITQWAREQDARHDSIGDRSWIGGHPFFVQTDVRDEPRLRKLNRVLLHLASDVEDVCLGDSGVLNLMISRKDLVAADFDKAFCTWDGS